MYVYLFFHWNNIWSRRKISTIVSFLLMLMAIFLRNWDVEQTSLFLAWVHTSIEQKFHTQQVNIYIAIDIDIVLLTGQFFSCPSSPSSFFWNLLGMELESNYSGQSHDHFEAHPKPDAWSRRIGNFLWWGWCTCNRPFNRTICVK